MERKIGIGSILQQQLYSIQMSSGFRHEEGGTDLIACSKVF